MGILIPTVITLNYEYLLTDTMYTLLKPSRNPAYSLSQDEHLLDLKCIVESPVV